MEAIIRTNDRNIFEALLPFLRTLHITVETKNEKKIYFSPSTPSNKRMAGILEKLSALGGVKSIPNPMEWQRETRKDRKII